MHTQYNLILAEAIKQQCFNDDTNVLMLHAEFNLQEDLLENLRSQYDEVIVLQDQYFDFHRSNAFADIKKKLKKIDFNKFDKVGRIILAQDNYLDMLIASKISVHTVPEIYSVEEDCYFSLRSELNNPLYKEDRSFIRELYYRLLRIRFGNNKLYEHYHCYAHNSHIKGIYLLYPQEMRKELDGKERIPVKQLYMSAAIDTLYKQSMDIGETTNKKIVFFFDLIERYNDPDGICSLAIQILNLCNENGWEFWFKYHPRETMKMSQLKSDNCVELPLGIPAEKVIRNLKPGRDLVIGNSTTAIQVANYYGIETYSVLKMNKSDNMQLLQFYENIGIHLPMDCNDICLK